MLRSSIAYRSEASNTFVLFRLLALIALSVTSINSLAQTPDLSDIQKQLDQIQQQQDELFQQRQRQQESPRPNVQLIPDSIPSNEAIPQQEAQCFILHEIKLKAIDQGQARPEVAEEFQWVLQQILYPKSWYSLGTKKSSILGKCYGVQGINALMSQVQNRIIEQGYVTTRVVAGPQDLNSGVLELTIIPGRIREIQTDRNRHLLPLKPGAILNLRHIEQALENLKSLPSVQTDIQILPAQGENVPPGASDLLITWQQNRPWRLSASIDDSGADSTGEHQGSFTFSYDDLANLNDSLSLTLGHDLGKARPGNGGTESYSLRYSFPVKNWTLSVSASENEFNQSIAGTSSDSQYAGESTRQQIEASRLIFRNQHQRLNAGIAFWSRDSKNFLEGSEVINQGKATEAYSFKLDYRLFLGRSVLNTSLNYQQIMDIEDQSLTTNETDPSPAWMTADINIDVPFKLAGSPMRYFGQIRYQTNFDPLSSQDYFSIGNRYNVRTGNSSSLSAERGWMIRNDFETARLVSWAKLYLGLDYGQVSGQSFRLDWDSLAAMTLGFKGRLKTLSYDFSFMKALKTPQGFQESNDLLQFSLNYQY